MARDPWLALDTCVLLASMHPWLPLASSPNARPSCLAGAAPCRYQVRMAVIDLDNAPSWWKRAEGDNMSAGEARRLAGTAGALAARGPSALHPCADCVCGVSQHALGRGTPAGHGHTGTCRLAATAPAAPRLPVLRCSQAPCAC